LTSPLLVADGKPVLEITGADRALQNNMTTSLPLASEPCDAPAWRIRQLFRRSPGLLDQAARALGYYHLKVEKSLSFDKNCWQAKMPSSLKFNNRPKHSPSNNCITVNMKN